MGCIQDTEHTGVGIETRRESFRLFDLTAEDHIIAFEDGTVEISYEFFQRFMSILKEDPELAESLELVI